MRRLRKINSLLCFGLAIAVSLTGMVIPAFSQQPKPVIITFGQPNIWSLEQAHYLLARMHRQNLDLQTATLGALDPNAANASRIDILKTLLQAGVEYDQAIGLNNQLLKSDKVFNSQRRPDLLATRSSLQGESTQLARDIAALKIAKAEAKTGAEREPIQAAIDAKTEQKAAVDNELAQTNAELEGLTSASGNFTSVEPSGSFSSDNLKGDLDALIGKVELINPSIAATLRLDNHIQMQYEIIAKQLTLLRDEVGPGERLVFLELPQSINATQEKAENKIAQAWWRIAGYTRVDKEALFEAELQNLHTKLRSIETGLGTNETLTISFSGTRLELIAQLNELCGTQESREKELAHVKSLKADKRTKELCEQLVHDIDETKRAIEDTTVAIQSIDDQKIKLQRERARLSQTLTSLSTKYEKLKIEQIKRKVRAQQDSADRLLQGGGADTSEIVGSTLQLLRPQVKEKDNGSVRPPDVEKKGAKKHPLREFIALGKMPRSDKEKANSRSSESDDNESSKTELEPVLTNSRLVRTIDIIPRQSAVNVNDTKERVSKTGIFAAVSFLFGFGGKFSYERQREQAEQFLNQELFTSGFGKGETDFGWNFYPFAGTKQLASGIRTTYAIVVLPKDAESLILRAQGCYFPRKDNQPLDYDTAGAMGWTRKKENAAGCTPQQQEFILPVPGGSGDGSDFYITEVRYSAHRKPGERLVASIYGQNLPSQIGVLINGVPLMQSVGLAQLSIESILGDRVKENCVGQVCGRFERIDSNQLVISFNMPTDFAGFPRISLVGPGKAIELNKLHLNINGEEDTQLDSSDFMFGKRPTDASRSIADFKVAPSASGMTGVLSGGKFKASDTIYVNGNEVKAAGVACKRPDLCVLAFTSQGTDYLTVTVSPADTAEEAVSRTFINPTNLSIISASVVRIDEGDKDHPPVVAIKLDGSGFRNTLQVEFDGTGTLQRKIVTSAGQMILEIASPKSVVQIILKDPDNNKTVSTVVASPFE